MNLETILKEHFPANSRVHDTFTASWGTGFLIDNPNNPYEYDEVYCSNEGKWDFSITSANKLVSG